MRPYARNVIGALGRVDVLSDRAQKVVLLLVGRDAGHDDVWQFWRPGTADRETPLNAATFSKVLSDFLQ